MRKLIAVVSLLALPSMASAGETFRKIFVEPITTPHLVVGYAYDSSAPEGYPKGSVILTGNVLGPRMGDLPCHVGGFGVGLETIAPGLEDVPIARLSFPAFTCAPFSERAVIQVGFVKPVGGPTADEEIPYVGIGVAVTESVESKDVRRAARIAAKKHKALLKLQDEAQGRTAP